MKTIDILQEKTLVIDTYYQPVMFVSIKKAFCMIFSGKAEIIKENSDIVLHSINKSFSKPTVIKIITMYTKFHHHISLNRWSVYARDNFTCAYCNNYFQNKKLLSLDHIIPISKGGKDSWENLITSCLDCNQKKGDKHLHEIGMKLHFKAYKPMWSAKFFIRASQILNVEKDWHLFLEEIL